MCVVARPPRRSRARAVSALKTQRQLPPIGAHQAGRKAIPLFVPPHTFWYHFAWPFRGNPIAPPGPPNTHSQPRRGACAGTYHAQPPPLPLMLCPLPPPHSDLIRCWHCSRARVLRHRCRWAGAARPRRIWAARRCPALPFFKMDFAALPLRAPCGAAGPCSRWVSYCFCCAAQWQRGLGAQGVEANSRGLRSRQRRAESGAARVQPAAAASSGARVAACAASWRRPLKRCKHRFVYHTCRGLVAEAAPLAAR